MTIANVTLTNTFDEWRTRTNQLISLYSETNSIALASFNLSNSSISTAANLTANILTTNATYISIITDTVQNVVPEVISSNTIILSGIYDNANVITLDYINSLNVTASFDKANSAQTIAVSAFDQANLAFTQANNVGDAVTTANGNITAAFNQANSAQTISVSAFTAANSALANTSDVSFNGNLSFPTGNIGIGRTATSNRLDVNGTINAANILVNGAPLTVSGGGADIVTDTEDATRYVTFANNTTGTFSQANVSTSLTFNPSTGTLSATIFNSTSDAERKTNIETIDNALETVSNLRGVSFSWKDTGRPSYGLVAQEVEQYIPELVETNKDGSKTLNYDAVIGFLVEAIKELKKNG
jgi:hypothetical protein